MPNRHDWNNRVKLRHLRAVLAIVDCGGITAAASRLLVSQAAISKTVAEVEETLAIKIFQRQGRALVPTVAGERFIDAARKISVQINNLGEELDLLTQGGDRILRVGLQAVTAHELFIRAAARVGLNQPDVRIQLREGHLDGLMQDLRAGRLDLVFGRIVPGLCAGLHQLPLLHSAASSVVASPDHPILSMENPRWPDLLMHPWVLPLPETPLRSHFDALVSQQLTGRVRCVFETTSLPSILALLHSMPLLALVPQTAARGWQDGGQAAMLDMTFQPQSEPLGLVWGDQGEAQPLLRLLRTELAEQSATSPLSWRGPAGRP
ncbi:LysR family transcriptional regulator [Falsirhodobacter sp. 20TX0035]|uniref:LysR family transcriptional regulator n=1 Tax=Falsirhodobacter sp. 20TX0035 TaxID=3022019 RepID=UPI002330E378|nr:LysR family transcriptional regulator [Falsirhodobacter sp. 20TX0035]MDB6454059.1 LysR family transcriptional regulator [Falsirhodobacter sp. 20TX0035]